MSKKVLVSLLSLSFFTLASCSNSTDLGSITQSGLNNASGFSLLDDSTSPEIKAELEAIKDLPEEERQAKMEELKAKYPELANRKGKKGHGKKGSKKGGGNGADRLGSDNPEFVAEMKALKEASKEERDALIAKYPEIQAQVDAKKAEMEAKKAEKTAALEAQFPGITAELEGLKDLSAEDKKAKMEEIKAKYPDFSGHKGHGKRGSRPEKTEASE